MRNEAPAADLAVWRPSLRSIILVSSAVGGVLGRAVPVWAQTPCASPTITASCTNSANLFNTLTITSAASIGALDNSGTIQVTTNSLSFGILNQGRLGSLDNEGSIGVTGTVGSGIINMNSPGSSTIATIGTLNNSGTITASATEEYGIASDGVIDTLNNNGAIELIQPGSTIGIGILEEYSPPAQAKVAMMRVNAPILPAPAYGITTLNNNGLIEISAGNALGILNLQGDISSLNNAGTTEAIGSKNAAGIINAAATISSLNNSGIIEATSPQISAGIVNFGVIGTMDNSGTIESTGSNSAGIANYGACTCVIITNLTNSGLIETHGTYTSGIANYNAVITTLTNAGTIEATGSTGGIGIGNTGTIGTLNNAGTIEGFGPYSYGVGNTGTIGTLNNSGTIIGATDALFLRSGTLGTLNNSGTIAGTIENDSGQALNIAGGSGAVFGVLTGYGTTPGAVGSLNSNSANVNFTGGNLLLNDNINVGNATVTDSGATIFVNGNIDVASSNPFMLNSGMLEVGDANHPNASLTSLNGFDISGAGILRGHGTVSANVINAGVVYPGGSIGNLSINGNYTQTNAGTLEIDVTPNTASQLIVSGTANISGTLAFNVNPGYYSPGRKYTIISAQSLQASISKVNYSGSFVAPLAHYLTSIVDHSVANIITLEFEPTIMANGQMLDLTSGRFYVGSAYAQNNAVQSVLAAPFDADETANRVTHGYWLHTIGNFGSANGYDFNSEGFVAGKGFDVSPHLTIGGAVSNSYTTSQAQGSSVKGTSFGLLAYSIYQAQRLKLTTSAGIGYLHDKNNRDLPYIGWIAHSTSTGAYEGIATKAQYGLLSPSSRFFLTPYVQASYLHTMLGAAQETNLGGFDLNYSRLQSNVAQLGTGATSGYSLPVKYGTLTAWTSLGGIGTIGNPRAAVNEYWGSNTAKQSALAAPVGAFTPALGVELQGNGNWHLNADWNGQFGSAISANNLTLQLGANW